MAWFKKARKPIATPEKTSRVPEGLWVKCPECDTIIYTKDLVKNLHVCGKCAHHFRLNATDRLKTLFDDEVWESSEFPGSSLLRVCGGDKLPARRGCPASHTS